MSEKFFPSFPEVAKPKKEESPFKNPENLMTLFLKLQNVYNKRPDITKFAGAMEGTKFADEYTTEKVKADNKWALDTREKIEEHNREKGQEMFSHFEENFAFAEAGQAMIVDRINAWMPDFKTIMTSDYDDLKAGIDFLTTDEKGSYFGTAFDVTVSSNKDNINNKLTKNWENNIAKGALPVVKYAEDPETGKKGRLLTPKFIVGASADDINAMANAYLAGDEKSLDNHPFRKLFLEQIRVQYNDALDYYESDENKDDARFNLARREYARVKTMIDEAEKKLDESQTVDRLGYHEYSKNSLTLQLINDFADKKK